MTLFKIACADIESLPRQPHPKAKKKFLTPIDRRTADDPKKVPFYYGDDKWWYKQGKNHRVENGWIARDMPKRLYWVIEIDDLLKFIMEEGAVTIFYSDEFLEKLPVIDLEPGSD